MKDQDKMPKKASNLALSIAQCKCARCRQGDMFIEKNPYKKGAMKMHDKCEVCGQPMEVEVGFYYGSGYVSYALSIAVSVATFIAWWVFIGFALEDNRIFYWLIANGIILGLLQPVIMRLSRAGWLAIFVRYNKNWKDKPADKAERMIKEWQNGW